MSFICAYLLPVFRVSSLKCLFLPKRVWRYLWNIVTYSFPMHLCSTSWKHQKTVRLILGGRERVYWKQTTRLQIFQGVIWFVWEKMLLSQLSYIWEQSIQEWTKWNLWKTAFKKFEFKQTISLQTFWRLPSTNFTCPFLNTLSHIVIHSL